jgi:hypothetical protein
LLILAQIAPAKVNLVVVHVDPAMMTPVVAAAHVGINDDSGRRGREDHLTTVVGPIWTAMYIDVALDDAGRHQCRPSDDREKEEGLHMV